MNNIERWKKIIISLPEQIFFDIIRNYLGELKTPFNKHNLMDDLAAFLRNEKTMERIMSLIDQNDAAVLTALSMLGPVTSKNLYKYFSNRKSYYDFYLHLQNLEERMLLCTEMGRDGEPVLIISPLYEEILYEKLIDSSCLVSSIFSDQPVPLNPPTAWLNDALLFSILSFLLRQGQILKIDGNFRKKVFEELKTIFPDHFLKDPEEKIDIIKVILRRLGLVQPEGDYFRPVISRWKELAELTPRDRWLFITGAVFSGDYSRYGSIVYYLLENMGDGRRGFTEKSFAKLIELFFIKNSLEIPENIDEFIKILSDIELVIKNDDHFFPNPWLKSIRTNEPAVENKNDLVIQPNFDIHVSKNISFADGLILALSSDIRQYSDVLYFTLSRESFIRALESGLKGEDVEQFFRQLGGYSIPQNVLFSMKSWEKDYLGINFHSGIVLTADEKKRNIIDKSGHFSESLCKKLGEGVYLVNPKNVDALLEAFQRAGIENLPSPSLRIIKNGADNVEEDPAAMAGYREAASNIEDYELINLYYSGSSSTIPENVKPYFPEIMEQLEKISFSSEQKEIITDRIERRIILFPAQISRGISRYEKTEAKGLDYNGKIRIAEQVTEHKGYLAEIIETSQAGESVKRLVKPDSIEKDGNVYYLKGFCLPDESEVKICISKISLIRKIKTSLFMK